MPAALRPSLVENEADASEILFATSTNLSLSGDATTQWLVITSNTLAVFDLSGSEEFAGCKQFDDEDVVALGDQFVSADSLSGSCLVKFALSDIDEVRTLSGVGAGRLQIRQGENWIDLLRYSNALASRFHKLSRRLQRAVDQRQFDRLAFAHGGPDLDPPHCDRCGLRLPSSLDVGSDDCPRCMQSGRVFQRLGELIAPYRSGAVLLCLLTVFGVGAELVPPKLQQYMVDQILTKNGQPMLATESVVDVHSALLVVVLALAFSRLMLSVVAFIKGRVATAIGVGLTSRIRRELVAKLNALSVAYYDRHNTGSIISRVSHDSEALHGLMHQFTGGFLLQAAKLIGVGIMLFVINPKLAIFTLIPVPFVLLGSWFFWESRLSSLLPIARRIVKANANPQRNVTWYPRCQSVWPGRARNRSISKSE